jgi:hypothetical protein
MALILSGDTGPSFVQSAAQPTGSVLQVVQGTYSSQVTSSSSTYADTGLTATITPKFSNSKILVCVQHNGCAKTSSSNADLGVQLQRNGTGLVLLASSVAYNGTAGYNYVGGIALDYIDSPATTSAVTYKTQFRCTNNSASVYLQIDGETSSITLMEIAG